MIADIGYGLNAVGYLLLLLLLLTSRQSGVAKKLLVFATAGTMLWSLSFMTLIGGGITPHSLYIGDTLKQFVWLLFLASCLRSDFPSVWRVFIRPETLTILSVPIFVLLLPFFVVLSGSWLSLLQTLLVLEMLLLLELVYRQAGKEQWAFKPLILFLGASQLYEFVLYAHAMMFSEIDGRFLAARGFVYTLLVPLLVLAVRRIKHWGINIFVSRDVVLHSSLLFVAGIYLMIMALAGYAVSFFGGSWSTTIQVILFSGSIVLLAAVFLSNQFRTKIKIFIAKHFFANQYDYRVEWVKLTKTLSRTTHTIQDVYQNALEAFLSSVNYDHGLLIKCNSNQKEYVASYQTNKLSDVQQQILENLMHYCCQTHWVLDLEQFKVRPFDYPDFPLSRNEIEDFGYQLVVPVFNDDKISAVVLMNPGDKEKVALDWEVRDYLTAVTEQVSNYLSHHEVANTLAENAQFDAFNRMSAFVLHDLKNVMAQIDLILTNAQEHKHNPEFIDDTFETLEHTKARMQKMLSQLTEKQQDNSESLERIAPSALINEVIQTRCKSLLPLPTLQINSECALMLDKEKFMNVIYHLISNAQQATDENGTILVSLDLKSELNTLDVSIADTGEGMSENFIQQRLFKPFDTTKGNAGMGIGVYDAKNYMESLNGKLSVTSEVGKGSCFVLAFPIE